MARKATIQDVAMVAGVSVATADRVLNRRGGVKPDKEQRVLAAARRLGIDRHLDRAYAHRLRVAVLMQPATNPFHATLGQAFAAAGRALADLNLQFLVYHLDPNQPARTAGLIDKLGREHDGLIVTSPASPAIAAALRRAAVAIPVVTLADDIPESGRYAFVGPDDEQAGRVAGELMGRFLAPQGGDVLVIAGLLSMPGHRARDRGFRSVLDRHFPACRVVAIAESGEDAGRAGDLAAEGLRVHRTLRGLYLTSAGAEEVVAALRAAARSDVVFVTHELTDDRRRLLRARDIQAVVDQDPASEVRAGAEAMARLLGRLDGEPITPPTPIRIYTAENC